MGVQVPIGDEPPPGLDTAAIGRAIAEQAAHASALNERIMSGLESKVQQEADAHRAAIESKKANQVAAQALLTMLEKQREAEIRELATQRMTKWGTVFSLVAALTGIAALLVAVGTR